MLSLFEMAIGKVFIVDIPCTLADGQFTIEARAGNFLAIHGEFITPAAWVASSEQSAHGIAGIDDGFAWFSL